MFLQLRFVVFWATPNQQKDVLKMLVKLTKDNHVSEAAIL
jgi:hypothetical protein